MKKLKLFLFLAAFAFSLSCSSDDEGSSEFPGVPAGEIVPVAQRMATLTKTSTSGKNQNRYWRFFKSEAIITGCGQTIRENMLEDFEPTDVIEIKFDDDFTYESRLNGETTGAGSWSWSDDEKKDGIILGSAGGVVFKFTKLNSSEVIYASSQTTSADGCSNIRAITYEQLRSN